MNSLIPRQPFGGLMSLHRAMNHMLGSALVRPPLFGPLGIDLALDMYETNGDFVVKATMSGVEPEDIHISVLGDALTIRAEIKAEKNVEEHRYLLRERSHGNFSRTITLPSGVEADKAQAEFEQGMLTLTIPKSRKAKTNSIQVKVK